MYPRVRLYEVEQPGLDSNLLADVAAVARIDAIPTMLDVICRTTGMGFAAVARVTEDRWVACSVRDDINFGLAPGGELKVETTICDEIRDNRQAVVIANVTDDPVFCRHPTPAMYGFQSYISVPIVLPNGTFFGTLCAIDPRPARLDKTEIVDMFKLFADLIAFHLDTQRELLATEAVLLNERESAELREQFIAVLGHDLRNPLAAIKALADMLMRTPLDAKATTCVKHIQNTSDRMAELIANVLDFAQGRLGGGLTLKLDARQPLQPVLEQVIAELSTAWPDRTIETYFALAEPVSCDRVRIGQLLSNLLGNALTHGAVGVPVRVAATSSQGSFELSVANAGEPIPERIVGQLFQPFFRASTRSNQQGLGLGLYIASEIARAHQGTLDVSSTPQETRFTLRMPTHPKQTD